jgi:uncharacterized membrane protein YGL010W
MAAGASFVLLAIPAYCLAVVSLLIRVLDWVAGKVLEAALPALTVIAWIASFAGRSWYAGRSDA